MKKTHRKQTQSHRGEARQTPRPSTEDRGLGPQPSASALTEPEPARDASGTGGASGGLNSSVSGVAGASLDRAPDRPAKRKAGRPRPAGQG